MKIQIRKGVFETNSSSVHSLTVAEDDEYKKWQEGECIYDRDKRKLISLEEAKNSGEWYDENTEEDEYGYHRFLTFEQFDDYEYMEYETYDREYTSKSGDILHIFGYYGHD